jgi:hypothetical protein
VVRDALLPERDVVRRDGSDDPAGGVLDKAPDVFVRGRRLTPEKASAPAETPHVQWGTPPHGTRVR